jgi:hypothetical protein
MSSRRERRYSTLVQEGDRYRDKETKKIYIVKTLQRGEIFLVGENGQGRRLTNIRSLEYLCDKLEDKEDKSS